MFCPQRERGRRGNWLRDELSVRVEYRGSDGTKIPDRHREQPEARDAKRVLAFARPRQLLA